TPEQKSLYGNYQQEEAACNARMVANSELLQLQSTLGLTAEQQDRVFASLYEVSFNQLTGSATFKSGDQAEAMQRGLDQKTKALEPILTPTQMEAYRHQQAMQTKLVNDILSKMEDNGGAK
ncbi:MAG TPA: hypothetical protein VEC99_07650, partial [Clostridia bacterium]|nr:hypothetical protein [Clostridia bacterium]